MPPTVVSSVLVAGAGGGAGGAASGSSTPGEATLARAASVQATAETIDPAMICMNFSRSWRACRTMNSLDTSHCRINRIRCCAFMRLFLFIGRFFTDGTYRARSEGVRVIPAGLHCVGWVMTQRCALHLFSVSRNLQCSFLLKEGGQPLPAVLWRNVVRGRGVPTGPSQAPPMPVHTPL